MSTPKTTGLKELIHNWQNLEATKMSSWNGLKLGDSLVLVGLLVLVLWFCLFVFAMKTSELSSHERHGGNFIFLAQGASLTRSHTMIPSAQVLEKANLQGQLKGSLPLWPAQSPAFTMVFFIPKEVKGGRDAESQHREP